MSRSNPTPVNPAQHFFTWSGSKGRLEWYNKEEQKRIPVKLPFTFMVLDELATITGFCEPDSSSYWSNEVRNTAQEEFTVRTSKGTKQVGLYSTLADVRSKGARYAKSIYIAHKIGEEYVIGNIKASGAALTAWIELGNVYKVGNGTIVLTGSVEGKKGSNTYQIPTFEYQSSTEEENTEAIKLDRELQVYLSQYLAAAQHNRENQEDVIEPDADAEPLATEEEVEDFENRKASRPVQPQGRAKPALREDDDEPINIDDIPF